LGNNGDNFHVYRFTTSDNIAKSFGYFSVSHHW